MSIKIHNFMGRLGWELQKRIPNLSADSYLKLQFISRRKSQKEYIDFFNSHEEAPYPLIVNLETVVSPSHKSNSKSLFAIISFTITSFSILPVFVIIIL